MILFTFRAFQILGENLLCVLLCKCSASKFIISPCIVGLQLHFCETWLPVPINCSCGEPRGGCSCVVDQLLGVADTVWANPTTKQELLREGKARWALKSTKLLHPWHCSSTSDGPRGDLLSTWGTPVMCPMWWLASLLETSQLVAGTPTGRFRISLKVFGAGSFYKVVGPMREANLFCCHDGIGQKWRAKKKKILFGSVPILAVGSNNMAGRVGA